MRKYALLVGLVGCLSIAASGISGASAKDYGISDLQSRFIQGGINTAYIYGIGGAHHYGTVQPSYQRTAFSGHDQGKSVDLVTKDSYLFDVVAIKDAGSIGSWKVAKPGYVAGTGEARFDSALI